MAEEKSQANQLMQYSFLRVFANDRTIDANELTFLEKLALKDGVVDPAEASILSMIFGRVSPDSVTPEVWDEISRFKKLYGVV